MPRLNVADEQHPYLRADTTYRYRRVWLWRLRRRAVEGRNLLLDGERYVVAHQKPDGTVMLPLRTFRDACRRAAECGGRVYRVDKK